MPTSPERTPCAVIACGAARLTLRPGAALTFGRGRDRALRIGHAPEDLHVPRFAGTLECRDDGVLVHNMSDRRTLAVRTHPGPGFEVLPLMVAGTRPHSWVTVVVVGRVAEYRITIDARLLDAAPSVATRTPDDGAGTVGFERIEGLSDRHRLLLCALCLPTMTRSGPGAVVPTYAEMERILAGYGHRYRARTIRNALEELRVLLTYEHGVAGLLVDDPHAADDAAGGVEAHTGFLGALARWAVHSGNVTDDDLDGLDGLRDG